MELRMQYATARDGTGIAFGVAGSGPPLVRTPAMPFSHVQLDWRDSAFYERLSKMATVVAYDSRGTGLSDRDARDLSLEARVSDLEAVVDRLGLEQFALHGVNFSSPTAITYAVRHPERVSHLILDDAFARMAADAGQPRTDGAVRRIPARVRDARGRAAPLRRDVQR